MLIWREQRWMFFLAPAEFVFSPIEAKRIPPNGKFFLEGEVHGRQRTRSSPRRLFCAAADMFARRELLRRAACYPCCRFVLPGDVHADQPVARRLRCKYRDRKYQLFCMDELEPVVYLSGERPACDAGLERGLHPIRPERDRDQCEL